MLFRSLVVFILLVNSQLIECKGGVVRSLANVTTNGTYAQNEARLAFQNLGDSVTVLSSQDVSCHSCLDVSILSPRCFCESNKCVLRTVSSRSLEPIERRCSQENWSNNLIEDGCITHQNQYMCFCSSNFCNGKNITAIRGTRDCMANTCPNGSMCLDTLTGYKCICPPWNPTCTYRKSPSSLWTSSNSSTCYYSYLRKRQS